MLIVEDKIKVSNAPCEGLQAAGFEIFWSQICEDGYFQARPGGFDLILRGFMLAAPSDQKSFPRDLGLEI
jgi:DNA-binding response OmpR family regulator